MEHMEQSGQFDSSFMNTAAPAGCAQVDQKQWLEKLARVLLNEPCGDPPAHLKD